MGKVDFNYDGFQGSLSPIRYADGKTLAQIPQVDFPDMARRALRYLENNPEPDNGWECLFSFAPLCCPPLQPVIPGQEGYIDPIAVGDTESRNDMAFNMMLAVAGQEGGSDAQERVHERLLSYVRKEGKGAGLCWNRAYNASLCDHKDYASFWATGMLLQSECDRFRQGKREALPVMRQLFEGVAAFAAHRDGRAYFPVDGSFFDETGHGTECYKGHYQAILGPLCEYYLVTRDRRCWDLLTELAEGLLYDLTPHMLHREDGGLDGHNHVQLHAVRGMAQFAYLSRNPRYIAWVKAIYDFYRGWALDTGWLPEARELPEHNSHSETCLNADMLEIEAWLALCGYTNLWDRVDRAIRNYFLPCQFTVTPALESLYRRVNAAAHSEQEIEEGLRFLHRLEGGFISAVTPVDKVFTVEEGHSHFGSVVYEGKTIVFDMMGCCPPEGMRAIYYAWRCTAEEKEDGMAIHLPYTVDAPGASVAARPDGMRVLARRAGTYYLRVPAWAPRDKVQLLLRGEEAPILWGGASNNYVVAGPIYPGDTLELAYPVAEFWQENDVQLEGHAPQKVSYHWVGNTVVEAKPEAEFIPLYPHRG